MRRLLLILALGLPALVAAAPATPGKAAKKSGVVSAAPVAPTVATAQPTPASRLSVTLKDGQQADVTLRRYDSVFLTVLNAQGTAFDLPWVEVASIGGSEADPDLLLMRGHLDRSSVTVSSQLAAKQPRKAFSQALWPGILLHGAGHRYAGDQDAFFSLAGGELFGLVVGGFGLSEVLGPEKTGESKSTAIGLAASGGAIFALTWLWDLGFAPGAARKFNQAHGLALQPLPNGAQLAYHF